VSEPKNISLSVTEFWWNFENSGQGGADLKKVEPYLLTAVADAQGHVRVERSPILNNSERKGRARPLGHGQVIYGPADPGGRLYFAIAIVESDHEIRKAGKALESALGSPEYASLTQTIQSALSTANMAAGVVFETLGSVLQLVAGGMKGNADDTMFVRYGTLLTHDLNDPVFHQRHTAHDGAGDEALGAFGFHWKAQPHHHSVGHKGSLAEFNKAQTEENASG